MQAPLTRQLLVAASDAELMRSASDDAFAEVVRRHGPMVGRVARSLADDPDDVFQLTFLSAWSARARFDPDRGTLVAWLSRIAHNRALDARRSAQRRGFPRELDAALQVACPSQDPAEIVGRRDEAAAMRRVLRTLSPEQRTALALAYYGDLTQEEIQARTHAPLGTVKGRIRLGLRALRGELADTA